MRLADGAIAQLGERLLCKQEVIGSIPIGSTRLDALDAPKPAKQVQIAMPLCAACCLKIRKYCFDAKFSSEIVFLFLENVAFAM